VLLALGQMKTKGKVSAEEMNQIAERGIPAWELLSKAIGKSVAETMKLAQLGRLRGGAAVDAIAAMMQQRYGGQMDRLSGTLTGRLSNLEDIRDRAEGLATQGLTQDLSNMLGTALEHGDLATRLANSVNRMVTPVSALLRASFNTLVGGGITEGLTEGIAAGQTLVKSTMLNMAQDSILTPFTSFFGIHSPSTLMYQHGLNITQGLANGIHDGFMQVQGRMTQAQKKSFQALQELMRREPDFMPKLIQMSRARGINPDHLLNLMALETAGSFNPHVGNGQGYYGLIQFGQAARSEVGLPLDRLLQQSATQQLDYVFKYLDTRFRRFYGNTDITQAMLYASVGAGHATRNDDTVMFRREGYQQGDDPLTRGISRAGYRANYHSWDVNGDGQIQQFEFGQAALSRLGAGVNFSVNGETVPVRVVDIVGGAAALIERSGLGGGGNASEPPFSHITDDQAQHVLDIFKQARANLPVDGGLIGDLGDVNRLILKTIDATNTLGDAAVNSAQELQDQVKGAGAWYDDVAVQSEAAAQRLKIQWDDVAQGFEQVFVDSLDRTLMDGENFFADFSKGFALMLLRMAEQAAAANLSKAIFGYDGQQGSASGGFLSKLIGFGISALGAFFGGGKSFGKLTGINLSPGTYSWGGLTSVIGGHRADGGRVRAGQPYYIGERGVEMYVPDRDGLVIPNHELGQMTHGGRPIQVVNNFHVTAPGGRLHEESQRQMAERTALAVQKMLRRMS